ncbi:hypothetical protein [Pararhodospirillum oryzae]|uniref:Uncharacterized protein n=1 Tax=Pararhodospirillum oryzae TaxID=478448 RepID=A0A512H6P0_9PROT|nr:hypothetical protein [Pararhodospirillum oryzae]GEO81129.1 hypothetical protein ROR02_12600 [Pararhodospirillum oryzae]
MHDSAHIDPTAIFLLWIALIAVGLLGSRWRARLPAWGMAALVFTAALCLVLGLVLLLP